MCVCVYVCVCVCVCVVFFVAVNSDDMHVYYKVAVYNGE
jgi:hypothetical protein